QQQQQQQQQQQNIMTAMMTQMMSKEMSTTPTVSNAQPPSLMLPPYLLSMLQSMSKNSLADVQKEPIVEQKHKPAPFTPDQEQRIRE
ncbi:hypothetical protein OFM21_30890, partial [Escherichia coli]|nr:hypothetical protein [Escherichia coli]